MFSSLELSNVGPISTADVEFSNLTLICGKNGVGKTYLSYSYYVLAEAMRKEMFANIDVSKVSEWVKGFVVSGEDKFKSILAIDVDDLGLDYLPILGKLNRNGTDSGAHALVKDLKLSVSPTVNLFIENDSAQNEFIDYEGVFSFGGGFYSSKLSTYKSKRDLIVDITILEAEHYDEDRIIGEISFFIKYFISNNVLRSRPFAITSERTGIYLFNDSLTKTTIDDVARLEDLYVRPIVHNIEFTKTSTNADYSLLPLGSAKATAMEIFEDCLNGRYNLVDKKLHFFPRGKDGVSVPLSYSSGSSKALLMFDRFIRGMLDNCGLLVIDEPELNLHLDAQKKIARVIAAIANSGVRVVVTTHSDHFVREINNLIMLGSTSLNSEKRRAIMLKEGVAELSVLNGKEVAAYVINSETGKTEKMKVGDFGVELELFNREIVGASEYSAELAEAIFTGE